MIIPERMRVAKVGMTAKIVKDNRAKYDKLIKSMRVLKTGYVKVGVLEKEGGKKHPDGEASVAEIATWNEFGTKQIPQRPFLRGAADENKDAIADIKANLAAEVQAGTKSPRQALESLGFKFKEMVRSRILRSLSWATPLADATVASKTRKGNPSPTRPLIDTGLMLNSVDFEVVEGDKE